MVLSETTVRCVAAASQKPAVTAAALAQSGNCMTLHNGEDQ